MGNCLGKQQNTAQRRAANWKATGIVSLRDSGLRSLPAAVLDISSTVKVLDATGNSISDLPDLSGFGQLQRLVLSHNALSLLAPGIGQMTALKHLAIDSNRLSAPLPAELGNLPKLEQLLLQDNQLKALPASLGQLTALKQLNLSNNQLSELPATLGACSSLQEIDASHNRLSSLPQSLGGLGRLAVLNLDSNLISALPSLQGCSSLHTLSLHANPITPGSLQAVPGWEAVEARRRSKFDRAIAGNALLSSSGMDEGVDRLLKQPAASPSS